MLIPKHYKEIVRREVKEYFMHNAVHPFSDFESIVENIYNNSLPLQELAEEEWVNMSRSMGMTYESYDQIMEDFDYDGSASDYVKDLISVEMTNEQYLLTR